MTNKGLTLSIYRDQYNCTAGGITAREFGRTGLTLVGYVKRIAGAAGEGSMIMPIDKGSRVFAASDERPAVALDSNMPGSVYLRPVRPSVDGTAWVPVEGWHMMGGNYAGSPDSRFGQAVRAFLQVDSRAHVGAVAVHDRVE